MRQYFGDGVEQWWWWSGAVGAPDDLLPLLSNACLTQARKGALCPRCDTRGDAEKDTGTTGLSSEGWLVRALGHPSWDFPYFEFAKSV